MILLDGSRASVPFFPRRRGRNTMVHLSEVLGLPVFDAEGARVGRVDDLRVDSHRGSVEGLVVRVRGEARSIPWSAVESFSPDHRRVSLVERSETTPWNAAEPDVICL